MKNLSARGLMEQKKLQRRRRFWVNRKIFSSSSCKLLNEAARGFQHHPSARLIWISLSGASGPVLSAWWYFIVFSSVLIYLNSRVHGYGYFFLRLAKQICQRRPSVKSMQARSNNQRRTPVRRDKKNNFYFWRFSQPADAHTELRSRLSHS